MKSTRKFLIVSGAVAGFVMSYFVALPVACGWLWPQSNMCGFPVMTVVAPFGGVIGGIVGALIASRTRR